MKQSNIFLFLTEKVCTTHEYRHVQRQYIPQVINQIENPKHIEQSHTVFWQRGKEQHRTGYAGNCNTSSFLAI
jgi:hypothetical protein